MNVSYTGPLSSAWLRMNNLLFRPFDLAAWFGLGFTAFLASLADGGGGGGGGGGNNSSLKIQQDTDHDMAGSLLESLKEGWSFLDGSGLAMGLIVLIVILVLVLAVACLYLSSRGRFMFLDNLVHKRSAVVQPWNEFGELGTSLFLWRIGYGLVVLMVIGGLVLTGVLLFLPAIAGEASWGIMAPLAVLFGTLGFVLIVSIAYIEYFLDGFVVPIMHKHRVGCSRAWGIFLALFREHPGTFVLSGLFYLLISFLGGGALLVAGLVTCCIGLLLMMIPYIGSVVTLPYSVTMRYWTLDFLGQFGDDYRLLEPAVYEPAPGGPGGPAGADASAPAPQQEPQEEAPQDEAEKPDLIEFDRDGTVIGPEDVGEDGGGDEPRPQG